ncbi:MAG: hypothetical protein ACOCYP_07090 [Planctomycetota bacterium]
MNDTDYINSEYISLKPWYELKYSLPVLPDGSNHYLISNKVSIDRFGDKEVPVFEIDVDRSATNGTYSALDQPQGHKEAEKKFWNNHTNPSDNIGWFKFSDLEWGQTDDGSDGDFTLTIDYDTVNSPFVNDKRMSFTVADGRYQSFTGIYYGRKDAGVATDLVDIEKDEGSIDLKAF